MQLFNYLLAAALAASAFAAGANQHESGMKDAKGTKAQMMDKNGDGMISRSEFMGAHEMMFDRMKNSDGMIPVKDMKKMKKGMMEKHGMDCPDAHP